MTSIINYSKSDKKVLKRLSEGRGKPVSVEGFDQHMRRAVIKLQDAGLLEVDGLTGTISTPNDSDGDDQRHTPSNEVEGVLHNELHNEKDPDPAEGDRKQKSHQPEHVLTEADQDSPENNKTVNSDHNKLSSFWFDDGDAPLTCARDYAAGQRCEHLRLGVFGRKSVCSRFNHRLDAEGVGFIPCPPCLECRTSDL